MLVLTLLINAAQVGRLNRKSLKLLKVPQTPFCIYKQCQIDCPQDLERYHNLTPVFFTENQSQFLIFYLLLCCMYEYLPVCLCIKCRKICLCMLYKAGDRRGH